MFLFCKEEDFAFLFFSFLFLFSVNDYTVVAHICNEDPSCGVHSQPARSVEHSHTKQGHEVQVPVKDLHAAVLEVRNEDVAVVVDHNAGGAEELIITLALGANSLHERGVVVVEDLQAGVVAVSDDQLGLTVWQLAVDNRRWVVQLARSLAPLAKETLEATTPVEDLDAVLVTVNDHDLVVLAQASAPRGLELAILVSQAASKGEVVASTCAEGKGLNLANVGSNDAHLHVWGDHHATGVGPLSIFNRARELLEELELRIEGKNDLLLGVRDVEASVAVDCHTPGVNKLGPRRRPGGKGIHDCGHLLCQLGVVAGDPEAEGGVRDDMSVHLNVLDLVAAEVQGLDPNVVDAKVTLACTKLGLPHLDLVLLVEHDLEGLGTGGTHRALFEGNGNREPDIDVCL